MATIPTFPTFTAGVAPTTAQLNQLALAAKFSIDPPRAKVSRTTGQSIANPGAFITFTATDFDNDNMVNLTANNDRITIVTPGDYIVTGQIAWNESSATGNYRIIELHKNGTRFAANVVRGAGPGGADYATNTTNVFEFAAGDYVQLKFVHDASASLASSAAYAGSFLTVRWAGE